MLARERFIEDLVTEKAANGAGQYVILGAGLDTFAQRRPEIASRLVVFEVDQPGPQAWKRQRLIELGFGIPPFLRLVPVDFEVGDTWWSRLEEAGFDTNRPGVVSSTGVSMYLTKDAIAETLRRAASLCAGLDTRDVVHASDRDGRPRSAFLMPAEMMVLAREGGFRHVEHVSAATLAERYLAGRSDGLRPPKNSEELLVAET